MAQEKDLIVVERQMLLDINRCNLKLIQIIKTKELTAEDNQQLRWIYKLLEQDILTSDIRTYLP